MEDRIRHLRGAFAYREFTLFAQSHQLRDNDRWTIGVHVMRRSESRAFFVSNTFETEEEALEQSLILGRRIVDGKFANMSVSDLG